MSSGLLSSNALPSSSSLLSGTPDASALLHIAEATLAIDRWQWSTPARAKDDNRSRYAENIDGPASEASSRASRLSSHADNPSAVVQHVAYTSGQGVYAIDSGSSLSFSSMPYLPGIRIEGLTNCQLYRLLKGTPMLADRL
ncbi:hypothetical protein BJY52DRAFT_1194663 [Lactarius psammicola]|nr:hypothetical protein BJY52DRAFT_1194663 [Lactarius psammicola]